MMSSTPKIFFEFFSWYTTFRQSFKPLSLLEQKLGRGDENTPPRPEEPQKAQAV